MTINIGYTANIVPLHSKLWNKCNNSTLYFRLFRGFDRRGLQISKSWVLDMIPKEEVIEADNIDMYIPPIFTSTLWSHVFWMKPCTPFLILTVKFWSTSVVSTTCFLRVPEEIIEGRSCFQGRRQEWKNMRDWSEIERYWRRWQVELDSFFVAN